MLRCYEAFNKYRDDNEHTLPLLGLLAFLQLTGLSTVWWSVCGYCSVIVFMWVNTTLQSTSICYWLASHLPRPSLLHPSSSPILAILSSPLDPCLSLRAPHLPSRLSLYTSHPSFLAPFIPPSLPHFTHYTSRISSKFHILQVFSLSVFLSSLATSFLTLL